MTLGNSCFSTMYASIGQLSLSRKSRLLRNRNMRVHNLLIVLPAAHAPLWSIDTDLPEHRYGKMLKPRIFKRGTNYKSYGLKFFPGGIEATDERGHWLRKHFR
jgi:hypothetical protein